MSDPNFTTPPFAPSRAQPATFSARMDAFLAWIVTAWGELATFVTWTKDKQAAIQTSADAVAASAANATISASEAAAARDIARGAANYRGDYNATTTYAVGDSVTSAGKTFAAKTVNTGVTPVDGANWRELNLTDGMVGDIRHSQGALPAPWLEANGGALSKAAQPTLAAQMGAQWPYETNAAYGTADTNPGGGVETVSYSGDYIAVGLGASPYIHIYDWNSGSPTKITNPASLPTGSVRDVAYSPNGEYLACAHSTSPYVTFYDNSTPGAPVRLTNPAALPHSNCYSVSWTSDSRYCAVAVYGNSSADRVRIYDFQSGSPVVTSGIDVDLPGLGLCAIYSPDDAFLVAGTNVSPYVQFYDATNPDSPTKMTDPATLPISTVEHVSWSPDGRYVAANTSSGALIYDMQSGSPVYVGTAANGNADSGRCFWLGNTTLAIPASNIIAYEIDGTAVTEQYNVFSGPNSHPTNVRRILKREEGADNHALFVGIGFPYFAFQPQAIDPATEFFLPNIIVDSDTFGGDAGHEKITTYIRGE